MNFNSFMAGSMTTIAICSAMISVRECSRQEPIENESRFEHHAVLCSTYCQEIDSVVLEIEWDASRAFPTCHCGPEWVDPE